MGIKNQVVAIGISASVGLFSALVLKASAHLFTTDAEAAAKISSGKRWENIRRVSLASGND